MGDVSDVSDELILELGMAKEAEEQLCEEGIEDVWRVVCCCCCRNDGSHVQFVSLTHCC